MHPYLIRLGVRPEVQVFFAPYCLPGFNDLLFQQGDYREHFGLAFHRVQAGNDLWLAGESNLALIDRVFISHSVMELIAFLHYYGHTLTCWEKAVFIAVGVNPSKVQLHWIAERLQGKAITLLFPADLLGGIADLKIASAFRRLPAAAFLAEKEMLKISFRANVYEFERQKFSLSAFEKASKYRFNIPTCKPKHSTSLLNQLKADALPPL